MIWYICGIFYGVKTLDWWYLLTANAPTFILFMSSQLNIVHSLLNISENSL